MFKRGGDEHPPAIELHLGHRYFAVTATPLEGTPDHFRHVSVDDLVWLLEETGPAFSSVGVSAPSPHGGAGASAISGPVTDRIAQLCRESSSLSRLWSGDFSSQVDQSRSARAMALGAALKRAGCNFDEMRDLLLLHPSTSEWTTDKGDADNARELKRIWEKVEVATASSELQEPSIAVLHRTALPTPKLPTAAFGPFWGEWMSRAAAGANAAIDYVAMPLLAVASALLGNARWVTAWIGWSEPPNLWLAGVGDPSSGKTPGAAPVIRDALSRVETWMARDFAAIHDEWQAKRAAAAARKEAWKRRLLKQWRLTRRSRRICRPIWTLATNRCGHLHAWVISPSSRWSTS